MRQLKPPSEWTPNPRPADDTSILQEHRSWLQLQIVLLICGSLLPVPKLFESSPREWIRSCRSSPGSNCASIFSCAHFASAMRNSSNMMRTVAREFPEKIGDASEEKMPDEVKQRMRDALRS